MVGQLFLPNEKPPLASQFGTDRAALFWEAIFQCSARTLWTVAGFSVIMLIGLSAGAAQACAKPSPHSPAVAFKPSLAELGTRGILPTVKDSRERSMTSEDLAEENTDENRMQGAVLRDLGKISGTLQRTSPGMNYEGGAVLDRPRVDSPLQDSKDVEEARAMLERQFALGGPPSPPPTTTPPDDGAGGDGEGPSGGAFYLRRFSAPEANQILDEWIPRVKFYNMNGFADATQIDDKGEAVAHQISLERLESFRSFIQTGSTAPGAAVTAAGAVVTLLSVEYLGESIDDKTQHLYGMYSKDKQEPLAIAGGRSFAVDGTVPQQETGAIPRGIVEFKYIAVNPTMDMRTGILGFMAMKKGLDNLAKFLSLKLMFDKNGSYSLRVDPPNA